MRIEQYCSYVSMVQSIILNIILGMLFSTFFLAGLFIFALLGTLSGEPIIAIQYVLVGIFMLLIIGLISVGANYVMYKICRKRRKVSLEPVSRKHCVRQIIIAVVAFICSASAWGLIRMFILSPILTSFLYPVAYLG